MTVNLEMRGFSVFLQFSAAARVNCAEMAGDRLRQPAYEVFSIKRRF